MFSYFFHLRNGHIPGETFPVNPGCVWSTGAAEQQCARNHSWVWLESGSTGFWGCLNKIQAIFYINSNFLCFKIMHKAAYFTSVNLKEALGVVLILLHWWIKPIPVPGMAALPCLTVPGRSGSTAGSLNPSPTSLNPPVENCSPCLWAACQNGSN